MVDDMTKITLEINGKQSTLEFNMNDFVLHAKGPNLTNTEENTGNAMKEELARIIGAKIVEMLQSIGEL